ncbi:DUF1822 family protein [Phormidium tenue FACHB-886]|nr:DUF1822 family protein [Phormidium tenue FACHB-886]
MIMSDLAPLTITIPLTLEAHTRAKQFRRYHKAGKAKQVYLNTLAVYAVQTYLERLEFETNLAASSSTNPLMQQLLDAADLVVDRYGTLECRPVLPAAERVYIPAEVWSDRIGYVAVQISETLQEATLLGFVEAATTEQLPLAALKPIETLPSYLNQLQAAAQPAAVVQLSQWLQNQVDGAWQTIEELFNLQTPAWQYRSQSTAAPMQWSSRGKVLNLGKLSREPVALVVEVSAKTESEASISVKVCPTEGRQHLLPDLELMILDEAGVAVIQAQARSTEMISVEFSGEWGDRFSTKIVLGETSAIDAFVI